MIVILPTSGKRQLSWHMFSHLDVQGVSRNSFYFFFNVGNNRSGKAGIGKMEAKILEIRWQTKQYLEYFN